MGVRSLVSPHLKLQACGDMEDIMKPYAPLAALIGLWPAAAFAHACPSLMSEIDQAMQTASLSESDTARVKELRTMGEEQHKAGDHDASMSSLEEAKALLGL